MNRYITKDDFIDVYGKLKQRGLGFILSKFSFNSNNRTVSAFTDIENNSSNWWEIPIVSARWNEMISGNSETTYHDLVLKYLSGKRNLSMLSLGCGDGAHELKFATTSIFGSVHGVDLSPDVISDARAKIPADLLDKVKFTCQNIEDLEIVNNSIDVLHFHSSLHHFEDVKNLIDKFKKWLTKDGIIVIDEYVGRDRLQYSSDQLKSCNEALMTIPKKFRIRFKSNLYKSKIYGPGVLRMIMADPSECVDSSSIIPALNANFEVVTEKSYGGNILAPVLKDISHHFYQLDDEKESILRHLFKLEDEFLKSHRPDFTFGIYKKIL